MQTMKVLIERSSMIVDNDVDCCNLTDHIRLPIIHTKTYINLNRDKRQEQIGKTYYINVMSSYKAQN